MRRTKGYLFVVRHCRRRIAGSAPNSFCVLPGREEINIALLGRAAPKLAATQIEKRRPKMGEKAELKFIHNRSEEFVNYSSEDFTNSFSPPSKCIC